MVQAAAAVIIGNRKILMIKRSRFDKSYPGFWTLPGGKAKKGEIPEENVIREVSEEVGLEFEPVKIISKSAGSRNGICVFVGKVSGEIFLQDGEIEKYGWFSYSETLSLDIAFSFDEIIKKLYKTDLIS